MTYWERFKIYYFLLSLDFWGGVGAVEYLKLVAKSLTVSVLTMLAGVVAIVLTLFIFVWDTTLKPLVAVPLAAWDAYKDGKKNK